MILCIINGLITCWLINLQNKRCLIYVILSFQLIILFFMFYPKLQYPKVLPCGACLENGIRILLFFMTCTILISCYVFHEVHAFISKYYVSIGDALIIKCWVLQKKLFSFFFLIYIF